MKGWRNRKKKSSASLRRSSSKSAISSSPSDKSDIRAQLRQKEAAAVLKLKNAEFQLSVELEEEVVMTKVSAKSTGEEAVRQLLQEVETRYPNSGIGQLSPEDFVIAVEGADVIITEFRLALHRVRVLQVCTKTFVAPKLLLCERTDELVSIAEKQKLDNKELEYNEIALQVDLDMLIPTLPNYLGLENEHVTSYRRKMTLERLKFTQELSQLVEEETTYMLHKYVDAEPLPPKIPVKIQIGCHMPTGEKMLKRVEATPQTPVDVLIQLCFKKFAMTAREDSAGKKPEDYVLKVTGYQDFLFGEDPIIRYDYIRRCISKDQSIILSLVETEEIVQRYPKEKVGYMSIVDKILAAPIEQHNSASYKVVSVNKKNVGCKLKVKRVEGLQEALDAELGYFVQLSLYNGTGQLADSLYSKLVSTIADHDASTAVWEQVLFTPITMPNLPLGTRMQFSVWSRKRSLDNGTGGAADPTGIDAATDTCVGWVNFALFSADGFMLQGLTAANLWTDSMPNPVGTCLQNVFAKEPVRFFVEFEREQYYKNPRTRPKLSVSDVRNKRSSGAGPQIQSYLQSIVDKDPLQPITDAERRLLWDHRYKLVDDARALPKFLLSVPWTQDKYVREAYDLIRQWADLDAEQALELVSQKFSDPSVRALGVKYLDTLSDADILAYLPQLTQALKFELHHDSPLATMLIQRAFRSRHRIGHAFFWHLKAEMHLPSIAERYGLLLEAYLRGAGTHRKELVTQNGVMESLINVALRIKDIPDKDRLDCMRDALRNIDFPPVFQLPLDPRYEVCGVRVDKCRYMDSKKLPLWLVFENAEDLGPPITIIFKEGDDLRQDVLTLQMLRIMDRLWKKQGMDLRMNPYGCVSTGDEIGMIEVVLNSITMAGINKKAGGARKVLVKDTVANFLKAQNNLNAALEEKCIQNFTLSCAAYCVATYVLGIGDRHNDNIMVTMNGHLFHIDFGHFLGNYKSKFGIKRERAPFVFTHQYAAVIGDRSSSEWARFVRLSKAAYITLRRHKNLFINLFYMMLETGIPELQNSKDIEYLRDALQSKLSDEEASSYIENLIYESLNTKTTLANDMIHILAH